MNLCFEIKKRFTFYSDLANLGMKGTPVFAIGTMQWINFVNLSGVLALILA